jgi:hypothetical protein
VACCLLCFETCHQTMARVQAAMTTLVVQGQSAVHYMLNMLLP